MTKSISDQNDHNWSNRRAYLPAVFSLFYGLDAVSWGFKNPLDAVVDDWAESFPEDAAAGLLALFESAKKRPVFFERFMGFAANGGWRDSALFAAPMLREGLASMNILNRENAINAASNWGRKEFIPVLATQLEREEDAILRNALREVILELDRNE